MTALSEDFVADLRQENTRLQDELRTARDRQDASAEILHVIGQSPTDVQPVFDAIVLAAARLLGRDMAFVLRCDGATYWCTAMAGPEGSLPILDPAPVPIDPDANFPSRAIVARKNLHLPDWSVTELPEYENHIRETYGINSALYLPLMNEGECIGVLGLAGKRAGSLGESEIALAESFRDQALIAIENVRLFNETRAALERQNASAEILRTIAGAPGDAERALHQIAETSARLFGAPSATIHIAEGDGWARTIRFGASSKRVGAGVPDSQLKIGGRNMPGTIVAENRQVHVPDLDNVDPTIADWPGLPYAREAGTRSMSGSPLRREGNAIGALIVYRDRLAPFSAEELAVQQTFADQAAIAIENARLFNETREALERQTATAEILKVIASSPSDTTPVFEAIATSATRLLGGFSAAVFRFLDGTVHLAAFTPVSPAADAALKADFPKPVDEFEGFRLAQQGKPFPIPDTEQIPFPPIREIARLHGFRSMLFVPLMNGGVLIGIISVTRLEPGAFSPNHIQLLQTFADQAVIAIENTRLFNETQEALERQTATADILKVIASSPSDVQPVFDAIAASSKQLLGGFSATVFRFVDDVVNLVAYTPVNPAADQVLKASFPRPTANLSYFEFAKRGEVVQEADSENNPDAGLREVARARGFRSSLFSPLMSKGAPIGLIVVTRKETGRFADHHVQLLQTFADQAVIAIENVRLFDEVQAKTRDLTESLQQQTATADVLKVISRSAFDLQTVLDTLVESAARLCDADRACVFKKTDELFHWVSNYGFSEELIAYANTHPFAAGPGSTTSRVALEGKAIHNPDVLADPNYKASEYQRLGNYRTMLGIPLLREGAPIGVFILAREQVRPFTDRQIELVTSFADQAVIAIENVRLFDEVQAKTRELSLSLDDLRTAQDRLVQTEKLASLGQLTAGIAHEIKNPLNFVNNFSALSAELTDELNDVLKSVTLTDTVRQEVDELTQTLKDNLERVVQHGKRADSIVKNMLLHSREGSGDHRPADINALLDESLNLAYHGARAEKREFNVTLQRDFDQLAGTVEVFPQEITRVFLNLIANGFYAVAKRKTENGSSDFEPLLSATTKNLGDTVEIRIRDNGTGIPAEVREKMFNPFFTTKPAGEGTGLGLSMSHDIIVKQHGGRIDVETEPGQFTEFTIVLPRTSSISNKIRGQT